jgi:hypothetical protein
MKKSNWLKNSIATNTGYFTKAGEKLKGARLTDEQVIQWNGEVKDIKIIPVVKTVDELEGANPEEKAGMFQWIKSKVLGTH